MTNTDNRVVAASDVPGLAALLGDVERGVTVVLTRGGRPVAVLAPPSLDGVPEAAVIAREATAAYTPTGENQVQPSTALARLVGGVAVRSVLGVFVKGPDRSIHQREIARRAGVGLRSAQLALGRLESLGLIVSERDGNRRYYRANHTARFDELRALLQREFGVGEVIARALQSLADRVEWAFIFGSAAEGRDTAESDLDLLVIGDVSRDEMVAPIAEAQRELGREIDLVLYRPGDFRDECARGNHFVSAVLAGPRIDVIGGSDDA